jgi:hypothetical protein
MDLLTMPSFIEELGKLAFKLQGHDHVQGLDIAIENRKGSVRKGVDRDGKPWRTVMKHPYGYLKGTKGKDGEEIDVYVGPHKDAPIAHVVHQHKADGTGHDEDKVMLGFKSKAHARSAYLAHYNSPKFLGPISSIPVDEMKRRFAEGKRIEKLATKPMDQRLGDGPEPDHTGRAGRVARNSTGGPAAPPMPEQAERFYLSNPQLLAPAAGTTDSRIP